MENLVLSDGSIVVAGDLDNDGELCISMLTCEWIGIDEAVLLIDHLNKVFYFNQ